MDKYVRGKVLGKGSFGSAILVTNKLDNKNYVIKEIDISRMPKAEREASEQEAKLLMALNHPNIVRCIECFTHMNKLCIVMDWCSEGDLYGLLQKRRGQQLHEDTIMDWLVQMCLGLKHVHDRKILHRDIKTQNVFVSNGGLLKLGDFGVSKVLNSTFQLATTAVGTPYYLSPEICQNRKYNQKSDIWSLGCVLYEMATLKHAFEAPNMRALISKIIKGSYPPMPSTRSRELRDLCDRMLTLDWQKRPSINDILATPIMKARIQKFLSATLQAHEFSHTIIHGRPKPGQLVVAAGAGAAAAAGQGAAAAQALGPAAGQAAPSVAAAPKLGAAPSAAAATPGGAPRAAAASRASAGTPAAAAGAARLVGASPNVGPIRGAAAVGRGGMAAASPAAAAAAGGRQVSPVVGGPAAAALKQAQEAAAAARAKAAEAAKQREEAMVALAAKRASDAEANARREAERAKAREMAAIGAQREVERMRLEEQRLKLEADRFRMEAEKRKRDMARAEEERRAKAAEEAEARRKREVEAKRKKAEEEARRRDAERAAKEKEREDMRARIAAQRKEFQDRQAEAARNRAAGEAQMGRGPPEVQVMAGKPPRRQWSPPRAEDQGRPSPEPSAADVGRSPPGPAGPHHDADGGRRGQEDYLTPEQRRAVWEEQRAAAEKNRRALHAERHGGIAAFLGVPGEGEDEEQLRRQQDQRAGLGGRTPAASTPSPPSARAAGGVDISPDARRAAYLEMRAAAERNRAAVEGGNRRPSAAAAAAGGQGGAGGRAMSPLNAVGGAGVGGGSRPVTPPVPRPTDPWAAKMARLEEERRKREQEILEFQRKHWQEVREARERNKRQIMAEVLGEPPAAAEAQAVPAAAGRRSPSPMAAGWGRSATPPDARAPAAAAGASAAPRGNGGDEDDDLDFAAMVKDMQDVLLQDGAGAEENSNGGGRASGSSFDDDDEGRQSPSPPVQFMLNNQVVQLPGIKDGDSLAMKVEALRMHLERCLGTDPFLKVYRQLESITMEDDPAAISKEFMAAVGQEKMPYVQLVYQLIACEEEMNAGRV